MNIIRLLLPAVAAATVLVSGCDSDSARPLSEIKDADSADSLLYYFGQMRAGEYWRHAEGDSTMKSPDSRKRYMQGVIDGLRAVRENDEVYNTGFRLGVRAATTINGFRKDYGEGFNTSVLVSSMRYGLENENNVDQDVAQHEYYEVKGHLDAVMQRQDTAEGLRNLAREAAVHKFRKASDSLYYEIQQEGFGPLIVPGDVVYVNVTYLRANGLNIGVPTPEQLTVGSGAMPEVITRAYCMLRKGSRARFMTTAAELFGDRSEIIGLRMSDVMVVTVCVKDIVSTPERPDTILYLTK